MTTAEQRFEIRPVGSVIEADAAGYLVNPCAVEKIQPPWTEAVQRLVAAYRAHHGPDAHGIFLRGSIPKGTAVEHVSDIDSFVVLREGPTQLGLPWAAAFWEEHRHALAFADGAEIMAFNLDELRREPELEAMRFAIKAECLCVEGEDLARELPPVRATRRDAGDPREHEGPLRTFIAQVDTRADGAPLRDLVTWYYKFLLRDAFLLVMEREGVYTRDLYPCWERFSRHYPDRRDAMRRVLAWALQGAPSRAAARALGVELGMFVLEEGARLPPYG